VSLEVFLEQVDIIGKMTVKGVSLGTDEMIVALS
jgi:hypothetical protein